MWNRFIKNDKGFTGLEAAIVLVAFVVVAAVFSYVMLGAGFYTTQKSQEVVHTGVMQASSSLEPSGDVIAAGNADKKIGNLTLYVTNTAGGSSVDLNKTIITYIDKNDFYTMDYEQVEAKRAWNYTESISDGGPKNLIDTGEKYKIEIDLDKLANTLGEIDDCPDTNEDIRLEIKPPEGAVLIIGRTMPASISNGQFYAVY